MTVGLTLAPAGGAAALLSSMAFGCASPMHLSELAELNADLGECALAVVPPGVELPCGSTGNPFLTSERTDLDCFGGMLFPIGGHQHDHSSGDSGRASTSGEASPLVAELEEFLLSVYHGEGGAEAGIFGLRFSDGEAARSAVDSLRARGSEGSEVHLKGNLVVRVWHDKGGGGCSARLDSLVRRRL